MNAARRRALQTMLEERRAAIQLDVVDKIRKVRSDAVVSATHNILDADEGSAEGDIELALIQMNSEVAEKITNALARLEQGDYGRCDECGEEIAEKRLRALPFVTRCRDCQEAVETVEARDRQLRQRGLSLSLGSWKEVYDS
jgi:DnaK suppressor protein